MAAAQVLRQPDIEYHPNFEKYQARSQLRQKTESLPTTIPGGFPAQLQSPLAWDGKDIESRTDWVVELDDTHLDEIDQALKHFKCKYKTLGDQLIKEH